MIASTADCAKDRNRSSLAFNASASAYISYYENGKRPLSPRLATIYQAAVAASDTELGYAIVDPTTIAGWSE